MSWRDRLFSPASFRGAPFFVERHELSGGRRGQLHEYPGRDEPYWEDLGRKARSFRVEAYVIGADYDIDRNALLKAVEEPGAGTLVHPWLGQHLVAVQSYQLSETKDRGRTAQISIDFVQAGENRYPEVSTIGRDRIADASAAVRAAALARFAQSFRVDAKPQYIVDEAVAVARRLSDALASTARQVGGGQGGLPPLLSEVVGINAQLDSLVRDSAGFGSRTGGLYDTLRLLVPRSLLGVRSLLGLADAGASLTSVPLTTASRLRQADNQASLADLNQRRALADAVEVAAETEFASVEEAADLRDDLGARIDTAATSAGEARQHDAYLALADMRGEFVRDIESRAVGLPRIRRFAPAATMPAFVIATGLYGDAGRADEIVARNRVRHPGFVPGGVALQVLDE